MKTDYIDPPRSVPERPGDRRVRLSDLERIRASLRRHPLAVRAFVLTLVWEIVTEIVGWSASLMIPPHTGDPTAFLHRTGIFADQWISRPESIWVRWDGVFFTTLGIRGYGSHTTNLNAFFPAYPLLIHLVGILIGGQYVLAAVLINRILLFPTVLIFTKLVERKGGDDRLTQLAPIFFLLIPGTVFFLGALSEMLFAFACLACLLALRRERYVLAGLACALATATRLSGLVLIAAVAVDLLQKRKPRLMLPTVAIGSLGFLSYSMLTLITEHDPLAFKVAYANGGWNDQGNTLNPLSGPLKYLHFARVDPAYRNYGGVVTATYLVAFGAVFVLIALFWRSMSWSYRVLAIGTAILPLLSGSMFAYYRYSIGPLLPIMIVACRWLAVRPVRRDATLLCLAGAAFFGIVAFAGSYWVS